MLKIRNKHTDLKGSLCRFEKIDSNSQFEYLQYE